MIWLWRIGACVERHEVSSGLLYAWRRQAMSGELAETQRPALPSFAEVRVIGLATMSRDFPPPRPVGTATPGRLAIELPSGVRVSVDASVDADALGRVIVVLAR